LFAGVPGVASVWDTVGSSVLGVKSIYPYNVPLSVNHFLPYNVYYPNIPNLVRNDLQSVPVSLRDVYNRPVMMVVKSTSGDEGLTVYFLEYGLSSLAENPQTKFIHDAIKSGAEKTAVVIHPTVLQNTPAFKIIKDLLVVKAYVPVGIKFGHFINSISHNTPYVFIHDKDDVSTFDLDGLVRVGTLDVAEEKVHCISCY
jgi:hypothetical protein